MKVNKAIPIKWTMDDDEPPLLLLLFCVETRETIEVEL